MNQPRVLLADDHSLILQGIRKLLDNNVDLVGAVGNGMALLEVMRQQEVDVVLLDISMPLLNGLDAAKEVRKLSPETKVIFLTMHAERDYVLEAFRVGASGYLLKWSAERELLAAIDAVRQGRRYVTSALPEELVDLVVNGSDAELPRQRESLTLREKQVLALVVQGKSAKEIADKLNVSAKTVEFHKYRMMKKLGFHTTVELARYALEHELVGTWQDSAEPIIP